MGCKQGLSSAMANFGSRWLKTPVKFVVSASEFTAYEISQIEQAMNDIQDASCIRFIQIENLQKDSVHIFKPPEAFCAADPGRLSYMGTHQRLMLDTACFRNNGLGITTHEIFHVLGFYHEQMRSDRDDYVEILFGNINPKYWNNFAKMSDSQIDLLNAPYDYGSLMHYGSHDFASSDRPAIKPLKPFNGMLGQRDGMSQIDIMKLNRAYQCGGSRVLPMLPNKRPSQEEEDEYYDDFSIVEYV